MEDHVSWLLVTRVKPGKLDALKVLLDEMVESTRREPGTLIYEWSISDDDGTVHIYERYADSVATMAHLKVFGERFAQSFLAALEPVRFEVFGTPSADVKEGVAGFDPAYMQPLAGFAR